MDNGYPPEVAGNKTLEYVFDLGFTYSSINMSDIFDMLVKESKDSDQVVAGLRAMFAIMNVKVDGGNKSDAVAVADLYGDPRVAKVARELEEW